MKIITFSLKERELEFLPKIKQQKNNIKYKSIKIEALNVCVRRKSLKKALVSY